MLLFQRKKPIKIGKQNERRNKAAKKKNKRNVKEEKMIKERNEERRPTRSIENAKKK